MNTTKRAIAESLKKLLLKKPITKITINDIAEDCGISRMTFYYHFQDIYDLVEWTFEQEAGAALAGNVTLSNWQQGYLTLLETVRANKPLVINVYRSIDREQVERYLMRVTDKLMSDVVEEQSTGLRISAANKKRVADFYKFAFAGSALEWVRTDMKEEPREIVDYTSRILQGNIRRSLERMSE